MNRVSLLHPLDRDSLCSLTKVLGYRADASYLELIDEAENRQSAAQALLNTLSYVSGLGENRAEDLAGSFQAICLLSADAKSLYDGAHQCRQHEQKAIQQTTPCRTDSPESNSGEPPRPSLLQPLNRDSQTNQDQILGYRADASYLELIDEADNRQKAAQHLLNVLSYPAGLNIRSNGDLAGSLQAIRLLSADARSLYDGAHQCGQREPKACLQNRPSPANRPAGGKP